MKVTECVEAYREDGDDWTFDHFSIILVKGAEVFKAQSQRAFAVYQDVDAEQLDCPLIPFPNEDLWPLFTNDLTPAPHPVPDDAFIKRPALFSYHPQTSKSKPRELLLHEAQICEILREHPHQNIASYLGCVNADSFIAGFCFKKYVETLSDRLKDTNRPLDLDLCLKGIQNGLDHLHSLGLNHNDINPRNVMLDNQDSPIIIDFDSCQREGGLLLGTGTPGWTDDSRTATSEQKNDDFALMQLRNTFHKDVYSESADLGE